jgi:uncharacterized protein YggU (UPF0235/DUF167 family)
MWYQIQNQHVMLCIYAKPNAKKTMLLDITSRGLHISIHAAPHDDEANKALLTYLSELLHLPKSHIILKKGLTNRNKKIIVPLTPTIQQLLNDPVSFLPVTS